MFSKVEKFVKVNYSTVPVYDNFWGYSLQIQNIGSEKLTVVSNYWQVPNEAGSFERVEEDYLKDIALNPGEVCEIAGYPPIQENNKFVVGSYTLAKEDGEQFEVHIPFFNQDDEGFSPKSIH